MKRLFATATLLALLSVPGFAANKAQTIKFDNSVNVGSTKLPAGEYKITWTGTGSDVQVTLQQKVKDNAATVTAPAKLVEQKNDRVQFITNRHGNVQTLESLDLKGVSLQFTNSPVSGQ